ncbi:MAG: ABC transporter ATP-binding protein [Victivallales bacterium]|nr:ABC transporter ATP-binding protein [Victivallales bacterium]
MKLNITALCAGYGRDNRVIDHLTLTVEEGEIITLIGANGSGKSTLLKTIGRLLPPESGGVYLDGRAVHDWPTGQLAREMAILPQLNSAPDDLSVAELVAYGRYPYRQRWRSSSDHDRAMVRQALQLTHLAALRDRPVATLSGGERQRAWIAMTLAQEPQVLLLDEPTTFLDVCHQLEIIELIGRMNRELGLTIVMVLHDLNLAARCSHRLAAIKDRRIRYLGSAAEIMTPEILRDIFNIQARIITGDDDIPYFIPTASCGGLPHPTHKQESSS